MHIIRNILVLATLMAGAAAVAESPTYSYAHIISNDFIGGGQDRWHTGSYTMSATKNLYVQGRGKKYLELRFRSEIVAPSNLSHPSIDDRPYVGILTLGLHQHARYTHLDTSFGVDFVIVGDQTRLLDLQDGFHTLFGSGDVGAVTQIGDATYPTFLGEVAAPVPLSEFVLMRPFVEVQAGAETFARSGVDVEFGDRCMDEFKIRDVTTGQRYLAHRCDEARATTINLGFDFARVFGSNYLPSAIGPEFLPNRTRIRFGVERTGMYGSFFFGLAWLGKEFAGQPEGQVVGSLSGTFHF